MYKFFIFSENPDKLVKFYTDILGFRIIQELKLPRDYGYMVQNQDGDQIWIAEHSEVRGYNSDPFRHIITIYYSEIESIYQKVKEADGVKIIQEPISMGEFNPDIQNRQVFTFLDPEGNCLQFMQPKK